MKKRINEILTAHKKVCLWFSGGDDSRLLLEVLLEVTKPEIDVYGKPIQPFSILRFDSGWNREQRKHVDAIILKYNLQVFSYPAIRSWLIANNEEIAAVSAYPVDRTGYSTVVLQDIVDDPARCLFDVPRPDVSPMECNGALLGPEAYADAYIMGTRYQDRHWSYGDAQVIDWDYYQRHGHPGFHYPIGGWTDEDVQLELERRGIDPAPVDTGNIMACSNCLVSKKKVFCPKVGKKIPPVKWDREANLKAFHQILRKEV